MRFPRSWLASATVIVLLILVPLSGGATVSGSPGTVISNTAWPSLPQVADGDDTRYTATYADGELAVFAAGETYWVLVAGDDPYTGDPAWPEVFFGAMDTTT